MKVTLQDNNDIHCVKFRLDIISDNPEETFFPTAEDIEGIMDSSSYDFGEEDLIGINRHFVHSTYVGNNRGISSDTFIIEVTNYKTDEWLPNEEDIERVMEKSRIVDDGNYFIVTEIFRTISKEEMRDIKLNEILRKDIIN
jgi:hypothetical protein